MRARKGSQGSRPGRDSSSRSATTKDRRGTASTSPDRSVYAGAPVYYEYDRNAKAITYWLFYAASAPPLGILRAGEQIRMRLGRRRSTLASGSSARSGDRGGNLEEFVNAYPDLAGAVGDRRGVAM